MKPSPNSRNGGYSKQQDAYSRVECNRKKWWVTWAEAREVARDMWGSHRRTLRKELAWWSYVLTKLSLAAEGQWCCYQSGSEDQEVTQLDYGGNTRDREKSSNAGAFGGKLLAHRRSDLLKRWEREGISSVSNSTPKFYFNRSSHCHRQVQISAQ